jgi:serine/threonine protein kinase
MPDKDPRLAMFREVFTNPDFAPTPVKISEEAAPYLSDPSRRLGQYVLVAHLGEGGMGDVWKAWDLKLPRWVAIKFLKSSDPGHVKRFQNEAECVARLHHPNIAQIHDTDLVQPDFPRYGGHPFIVMQFVEGKTLDMAGLPADQVVRIGVDLARALEAAHRQGIIHRDIKPQNILVTTHGHPYVMDFGLAKLISTERTSSGVVLGTLAYMSPEQASGDPSQVDERSDIYSLGATLYTVLCGQSPFRGETTIALLRKICTEEPIPPRQIRDSIPRNVEHVVLTAMAREKKRRYSSAESFANALGACLAGSPVAPPSRGTRVLPLVTASVLVLLALGIALFALKRHSELGEFERQWTELLRLHRYESALGYIRDHHRALGSSDVQHYESLTIAETNTYLGSRLLEFHERLASLENPRALPQLLESLPLPDELKPALPPAPQFVAWARSEGDALKTCSTDEAFGRRLLGMATKVSSSPDPDERDLFHAFGRLGFQVLYGAASRLVKEAGQAVLPERQQLESNFEAVLVLWQRFLESISEVVRANDSLLKDWHHRLAELREELPKDLPDFAPPHAIDTLVGGAFGDPWNPLSRLERLEGELLAHDDPSRHLTLESRRRLYTAIVVVRSLRRSLESGAVSAEEIAKELSGYRQKLMDVGGPEPIGSQWGSVVARVFELLTKGP